MDRYAAMANNPVNLIDPSGHCTVSGHVFDDGSSQCQWASDAKPVRLTHARDKDIVNGKTTYRRNGGAEMYQLYIDYKGSCGWWNNDCASEFGIKEFIGMYLLFESNANSDIANVLATTLAQNLYVGGFNPANCPGGGVCENAALNFIAANIDGNSALFAGPTNKSNQNFDIDHPRIDEPASKISSWGTAALAATSVVSRDRNVGPSSWGNYNGWASALGNIQPGLSSQTVYYYAGNAIYYSVNQYNYWSSLDTDMTMAP
jgi:hypothetical protein